MINKEVFVVGSVNVDFSITVDEMPLQGETITGNMFNFNIGGKGRNQAVAASKMGLKTNMICSIGNDQFASIIVDDFVSNGIDIKGLRQIDNESTGVAMIIRKDNDNRIILNPGANYNFFGIDLDIEINGKKNDLLILQYEIDVKTIKNSLMTAKRKEMITVVNAAPANYVDDSLYQFIDYMVINQTECRTLSGFYPDSDENNKKAFEYFFSKGIKNVIITTGADGNVFSDQKKIIKTKSYDVKVVDTTGAGDAFVGAFAYGLASETNILDALKIASAAGATTCAEIGVEFKNISKEEIIKMIEEEKNDGKQEINNY